MCRLWEFWISSLGISGFEEHCCWFCEYFFRQLHTLQEKLSGRCEEILCYCCADIKHLQNEKNEVYDFLSRNVEGKSGIFILFDKKSQTILYIGKSVGFTFFKSGLWPVGQLIKGYDSCIIDYINNNNLDLLINDCCVFFLLLDIKKTKKPDAVLKTLQKELKKLLSPIVN